LHGYGADGIDISVSECYPLAFIVENHIPGLLANPFRKGGEFVRAFMAFIGVALLIVAIVVSVNCWISFKAGCEDYLKLAGDAPTVERAHSFLGTAVAHIESHNLTQGNAAFIFKTPSQNLGIWYGQIKGAYDTAGTLLQREKANPGSVTQLERDNALMKIREVVLDQGDRSPSVTAPKNAWLYPNQWGFVLLWIVTVLLCAVMAIVCIPDF
jgi:hypothetical protein